jgi:hypothetical protein
LGVEGEVGEKDEPKKGSDHEVRMTCSALGAIPTSGMVVTASILTLGVAVAVAGQVAKHRIKDPRLPFAVGLALTLIAPTFLMALVVEVILLFTWNPLNWME